MSKIFFSIPGEPKGKGRPRFSRKGKFVKIYTPEETTNYEDHVRNEYRKAAHGQIFTGEVHMEIDCYFSIPKSTSKKKTALMVSGEIRPTKKPDADNVAKIVADALNNVAYKDDTQIVELIVRRWYTDGFASVDVLLRGESSNEPQK